MTAINPTSPAAAWSRSRRAGLAFRAAGEADIAFLSRLYASTRMEELAVTGWSEVQKAAFLDMQFQAQHAHYHAHYPEADWLVVEHAREDIGRLYIERWPSQHRIIDIAFLPAHRRKGHGTALLRDLIDEAWLSGKYVSIHVEKNSPARRLYLDLGFAVVEDKGVYDLMACAPAAGEVIAANPEIG
ncbi:MULTISPECIES: GNAT family N-acetyltransferase [unclassified Mesorhizobium]|uniref:GNAT family N-acetyltransferase n=1 Tax=unclassified Mesorhizobium TaxID=325217 RepID=UPI001CCAD945|nr:MULTISPECIES: GNAT family N-acetyltransferase [unclassified Mesorhizobium]MBZ9737887.1 GNAT family N-acetyltransferase [Mesorhizobium sp. CO1-1-4]MBZ9801925.1 GNAT family N-acetyltransferase [Mesorhizobium sp. ES1-6]